MACSGTVGSCSGGCGSACTGGCSSSSSCSGCSGFCKGGCYNSCGLHCGSGCSGTCTDACSGCGCGCANTCSGGCTVICNNTCDNTCTGCTGNCKGACNKGCTNTTQVSNYNAIKAMSEKILASDANYLRAFINYEINTRRGKTLIANSDATANSIIDNSWWNKLKKSLETCISVDGEATEDSIINKSTRDALVQKAIELYNQTIGKP